MVTATICSSTGGKRWRQQATLPAACAWFRFPSAHPLPCAHLEHAGCVGAPQWQRQPCAAKRLSAPCCLRAPCCRIVTSCSRIVTRERNRETHKTWERRLLQDSSSMLPPWPCESLSPPTHLPTLLHSCLRCVCSQSCSYATALNTQECLLPR